MKYRNLQIAWSIACGILCLLLIALWVQSYNKQDSISRFEAKILTQLQSKSGSICFTQIDYSSFTRLPVKAYGWKRDSYPPEYLEKADLPTFEWKQNPRHIIIRFPHLLPAASLTAIAIVPWLRWRFSLRTLLIAATVVAVILGLAVMMLRGE